MTGFSQRESEERRQRAEVSTFWTEKFRGWAVAPMATSGQGKAGLNKGSAFVIRRSWLPLLFTSGNLWKQGTERRVLRTRGTGKTWNQRHGLSTLEIWSSIYYSKIITGRNSAWLTPISPGMKKQGRFCEGKRDHRVAH